MQKVVEFLQANPVVIAQNHCLHCRRCAEICPQQCIEKKED